MLYKHTLTSLKQIVPRPLAGGLKKARGPGGLQVGLVVMQQPCSRRSIKKLKQRRECVDKQENLHTKSVSYVESGIKAHCMLFLVIFLWTKKHTPYLERPLF